MSAPFRWSDEETTQLIDLHKAGLDRVEIARALNIEYVRVKSRMIYLGLTGGRKPIGTADIDVGQKMHELARLRFSIDECAYALDITLPKAFALAEWYCVRFDEVPVDMATVRAMLAQNRSHGDIARVFGCSHQKIAALAKVISKRRRAVEPLASTNEKIVALHRQGVAPELIAARVGVKKARVIEIIGGAA